MDTKTKLVWYIASSFFYLFNLFYLAQIKLI